MAHRSSSSGNAKHDELVEGIQMDMAVEDQLLNNPLLYNYEADWQRVFEVLPELLEPGLDAWPYREDRQRKAVEALRAYAAGGVARAPPDLVENLSCPNGVPGFPGAVGMRGEELEYHLAKALQSDAHRAFVIGWLVLEDEEALETGNVAVIFLDTLGNVVRSKRVTAEEAEQLAPLWQDLSFDESSEWEDGELGPEYQRGGSRGYLLLDSMRDASIESAP
ncbi:MAG: hypothetical protein Q9184_003868 [Pyrenodesmia sp. 2 TL-2023]